MIQAEQIKDKQKIAANSKKAGAILTEALGRYDIAESRERTERKQAVEDIKFAQTADGQWDEFATKQRKGRPRYTINKIAAAIDMVIGEQRQSQVSVKVRPAGGDATKELAETFNGLIRNIESVSSARNAYDSAFDEVLNGGYGGFRVDTVFNDDDTMDKDIRINPIDSATTSLYFDPNAQQYDKRDALWAFVTKDIGKDEFEAMYPKATVTDFQQKQYLNGNCRQWFSGDTVRIAEYWRKVPVTRRILQLNDGRIVDRDEVLPVLDEYAAEGITVVSERKVKTFKVERYIMNGAEILDGPHDWAGKYFPLIPVYGKITKIENQTFVRGMVRFAKDPQRIYNYTRSTIVEVAALTPKDPYWMTPLQAEGHEAKLARMNTDNSPVNFYNPDPSSPGIPQRSGAPSLQQALIEQGNQAANDVVATLGVERISAQTQAGGIDQRGVGAVLAQQSQGEAGATVYFDNMAKSIEYLGVVLVDLMPRVYDTERQLRIMQPDGETELVMINQTKTDDQTGLDTIVNDLKQGKYDVAVTTGPMFSTKRTEAAAQLIDLATNSPEFASITPDLIAKNLDVPGSDELHTRMRQQMIKQGIVQPTDDERQELGLDEAEQIKQQLIPELLQQLQGDAQVRAFNAQADQLTAQAQKTMADVAKSQAETAKLEADTHQSRMKSENTEMSTNKLANESLNSNLDAVKKQLEMGIPLSQQTHDMRIGQSDLVEASQMDGDTSEQRSQEASRQQAAQELQQLIQSGLISQ